MASLSDAALLIASARLRLPLASAHKHASAPWAFAITPPSRREAEGQAARARSHTAQEKAQQEDQFHAQETWRGRTASGRRTFEVALAPPAREREHKYGGTETLQKEQSQESAPLLVGVRTPWPSRARLPPVAHFYKPTSSKPTCSNSQPLIKCGKKLESEDVGFQSGVLHLVLVPENQFSVSNLF